MLIDELSQHIGVPVTTISKLLALKSLEVHEQADYKALVKQLNPQALEATLRDARHVLDANLPAVVERYTKKYKLDNFPLSGYMVSNWVMGYLNNPEHLPNLIRIHQAFTKNVMIEVVPEVLQILGKMDKGREAWQRAFATLVLPMIAK
jgi:hypothetical protein